MPDFKISKIKNTTKKQENPQFLLEKHLFLKTEIRFQIFLQGKVSFKINSKTAKKKVTGRQLIKSYQINNLCNLNWQKFFKQL